MNLRGRVTGLPAGLAFSRIRREAIEHLSRHDVRWRSLGALYLAGGVLALASLALPTDPGSQPLAICGVALTAVVTGLFLLAASERLPKEDGWLSAFLALGTALITLAVIFNRVPSSPYVFIYIWVSFDGFFFLSRRAAFLHLAWVGLNYLIALLVIPSHGEAEAARWLVLMGTVGVIGALADILRSRSEELIEALSEVARTDSLTGLLNRRGFEERLRDELRRAARSRPRSRWSWPTWITSSSSTIATATRAAMRRCGSSESWWKPSSARSTARPG